ncbi:ATPase domain-containing protein [Chloroflexota bacterium]
MQIGTIGIAPQGIMTGVKDIDAQLVGGVRAGSLVFIEGTSASGKSVLCQHLVHSALNKNTHAVAYYSTKVDMKSRVNNMESLSLHALNHLLADNFRIYPLSLPIGPRPAMKAGYLLAHHIANLPEKFDVVVIDSVTPYLAPLNPVQKADFFRDCKALCKTQRIVILTADPYVFEKETHPRIRFLCDYHLLLQLKTLRFQPDREEGRIIRKVYVRKIHGTDIENRPGIRFTVEPKLGITSFPFARVTI